VIECARAYHTRSRAETKIVAVANLRAFGDASPPMQRRVVALVAGVVGVAMLAATARAQPAPLNDNRGGGSNLRDRYEKPRQQQKLEDAIRKFGEDDVQTRLEGVEGLGENAEDPKAIEYLLRGAADADLSVRVKSIDIVGNARLKQAVPLLVQQLFMRDTTLATKQHILASLGKIGDPSATKPILDFLARDVDPSVRGSAVYALGDIGDRAALPSLEKLAKSTTDENFRGLTQSAIRKIEQKPAPSVVPPALADRRAPPKPESDETDGTP
jgi:HEAT repeat protein